MPPESRFTRLSPGARLDQATVNLVETTPLGALPPRDDGALHVPLNHPAAQEHGWSPPADPIPTDAELRTALVEALEVQGQTDDLLADCAAADQRAQQHLLRCTAELHAFDGLDEEVAQATIEQLVGDTARVELSDTMHARIGAREAARVSYAAAVRAAEVLAKDLVQARGRAAEAGASVERLLAAILTSEAARLATDHAELLRRAGMIATQLLAFNLFSANRGIIIPPAAREILAAYDVPSLARQHDKSAWLNAADVLRSNPMAEVRIDCAT